MASLSCARPPCLPETPDRPPSFYHAIRHAASERSGRTRSARRSVQDSASASARRARSRGARRAMALLELLPRAAPAGVVAPELRRAVHDRRGRRRAVLRDAAAARGLDELVARRVEGLLQLEGVGDGLDLLEVREIAAHELGQMRDGRVLAGEAPGQHVAEQLVELLPVEQVGRLAEVVVGGLQEALERLTLLPLVETGDAAGVPRVHPGREVEGNALAAHQARPETSSATAGKRRAP